MSVKKLTQFYTEDKSEKDITSTTAFHTNRRILRNVSSRTTTNCDSNNNYNVQGNFQDKSKMWQNESLEKASGNQYITASNTPTPRPRAQFNNRLSEFTQEKTAESRNASSDDERYESILFPKVDTSGATVYEMEDSGDTVYSLRSSDDDDEPEERNKNRFLESNAWSNMLNIQSLRDWSRDELDEVDGDTLPTILKRKSILKVSPSTNPRGRDPVKDEVTSPYAEDSCISRKVQFSRRIDDTKYLRNTVLLLPSDDDEESDDRNRNRFFSRDFEKANEDTPIKGLKPKATLKAPPLTTQRDREPLEEMTTIIKSSVTKQRSLSFKHKLSNELSKVVASKSPTVSRSNTAKKERYQVQKLTDQTETESGTISMTIKQLIDSESNCLNKMAHVIECYIKYFRRIRVSPEIQDVFGNFEQLHSVLREMYADLEKCSSVDEVASVFLTHVEVFDHYIEYVRNKSLSQQLATKTFAKCIQDRQSQVNDRVSLESYLLDPTRRLEQYNLLLKNLQKESSNTNKPNSSLDEVITLIEKKISQTNTLLAIDSIEYCPIDLMEKGAFIRKDMFNPKKGPEMVVFLFQKCVVFCAEDKDKFRYNFLNCLDMDNLACKDQTSKTFELRCLDKSKLKQFNTEFEFTLKSSQKSTKDEWVSEIQRILSNQESSETQEGEYESIDPIENLRASLEGDFFLEEAKIISELTTSEKDFLRDIKSWIDNFYSHSDISYYKRLIIENMESIYNETDKLYLTLVRCNSRDDVAIAFLENENLLDSFTIFIKNGSSYAYIGTELKKRLYQSKPATSDVHKNWNECITNLSEKPTKYKEFLERLQMLDVDKPSKVLKNSIKFINNKIKETITATNIDCIHRCPIDLNNVGTFLKKGTVTLKNNSKCELFLFQELIVFCVKDEHYQEAYLYFDSMWMDEVSVLYAHNPLELQLRCSHWRNDGNEVKYKYDIVFCSQTARQKWLEEIDFCGRLLAKRRRN